MRCFSTTVPPGYYSNRQAAAKLLPAVLRHTSRCFIFTYLLSAKRLSTLSAVQSTLAWTFTIQSSPATTVVVLQATTAFQTGMFSRYYILDQQGVWILSAKRVDLLSPPHHEGELWSITESTDHIALLSEISNINRRLLSAEYVPRRCGR